MIHLIEPFKQFLHPRFHTLFAQQIRVTVVVGVVRRGGTVDEIDVSRIGELQDAFDIVGMQSPYLVHHAMYDKVASLLGRFFLEHIDEHDVHHRFHQNVCTIRPHIVDTLHPEGVIVVLLDAELQAEGVAKRDFWTVGLVQ